MRRRRVLKFVLIACVTVASIAPNLMIFNELADRAFDRREARRGDPSAIEEKP